MFKTLPHRISLSIKGSVEDKRGARIAAHLARGAQLSRVETPQVPDKGIVASRRRAATARRHRSNGIAKPPHPIFKRAAFELGNTRFRGYARYDLYIVKMMVKICAFTVKPQFCDERCARRDRPWKIEPHQSLLSSASRREHEVLRMPPAG